MTRETTAPGYQLFMLALCIYALAQLAIQSLVPLDAPTLAVLEMADVAVCVLFFLDFVQTLLRSPDRWLYLRTWGWIDFLSSIPAIDAARLGRVGRVLRVLRVLRGLRATRSLAALLIEKRAENAFLAVSLVALLMIIFSSISVLQFETAPDSNIRSAEDAIWWAFTTITTVGYGDRFPVTTEGRFVAGLLMAAGVGLFGTFSGFLAAWLIGPSKSRNEELSALRVEVAALRETIAGLTSPTDRRPE